MTGRRSFITEVDYTDDLVLPENTPTQAKSLLYCLEQTARNVGLYKNTDKSKSMRFKQERAISALSGKPLNLGSHILYTERDVNIRVGKV